MDTFIPYWTSEGSHQSRRKHYIWRVGSQKYSSCLRAANWMTLTHTTQPQLFPKARPTNVKEPRDLVAFGIIPLLSSLPASPAWAMISDAVVLYFRCLQTKRRTLSCESLGKEIERPKRWSEVLNTIVPILIRILVRYPGWTVPYIEYRTSTSYPTTDKRLQHLHTRYYRYWYRYVDSQARPSVVYTRTYCTVLYGTVR